MMAAVAYIWLGLVLGVSFLATPIKFRAQSLTMPVALDVGRATFHAFGALEVVLSIVIAVVAVAARTSLRPFDWVLVGLVIAIVIFEGAWLIPRLDTRVEAIIDGRTVPDSHLHLVYIGAEVVKSAALLTLGAWTARHL